MRRALRLLWLMACVLGTLAITVVSVQALVGTHRFWFAMAFMLVGAGSCSELLMLNAGYAQDADALRASRIQNQRLRWSLMSMIGLCDAHLGSPGHYWFGDDHGKIERTARAIVGEKEVR